MLMSFCRNRKACCDHLLPDEDRLAYLELKQDQMIEKDHCKLRVSAFSKWGNDVVQAIALILDKSPTSIKESNQNEGEFSSPLAPFQVINIGNGKTEKLLVFIKAIEIATGISANMKITSMQAGDFLTTFSDCSLLENPTVFTPKTPILGRISSFVDLSKEMDWSDD